MKYTKIEKVGNNSIEHIVEGDYSRCSLRPHEEVLAIFTELEAKDAVEYHGSNTSLFSDWELDKQTGKYVNL